ncbi:DUF6358 family protein [Pedobacter metabolipauper]|uniref:Uncharacterized protein n=1 Tax=Pedobacter metabolipauper TaxID=425513 RepID=A0A4V3D161_9SPHI|nr:DUF6358 family protein [Pedobacter metabolipauper]TDQ09417.1 hypothetical protein ATK78_1571 [Pedobacter metabolipauper]
MKKKIALNVFYNLGIIVSICGIFWAFRNGKYPPAALFVATGGYFVYLKIQLVKEMRNLLKK